MSVQTGSSTGGSDSGSLALSTASAGSDGLSGSIDLKTGPTVLGTSGSIVMSTGGAQSGDAGALALLTGDAPGGSSGSVSVRAGASGAGIGADNPFGYPASVGFDGPHRTQRIWSNPAPNLKPFQRAATMRGIPALKEQGLLELPYGRDYLAFFPNLFLIGTPTQPFSHTVYPIAADRSRGLGFGLSLARSLLRAHGGELVIEAAPGIGARAFLSLPPERMAETLA